MFALACCYATVLGIGVFSYTISQLVATAQKKADEEANTDGANEDAVVDDTPVKIEPEAPMYWHWSICLVITAALGFIILVSPIALRKGLLFIIRLRHGAMHAEGLDPAPQNYQSASSIEELPPNS